MELAQHPWSTSLQAGAAIPIQLFPLPSCAFTSPFHGTKTPVCFILGKLITTAGVRDLTSPLLMKVSMCISASRIQ